MTPIANCLLALPATLNTCCIRSFPVNASITTLSLFVNTVTTFNYLVVHPFLETKTLSCSIAMLFTDNSIFFSSCSLSNSVLSVILLKLAAALSAPVSIGGARGAPLCPCPCSPSCPPVEMLVVLKCPKVTIHLSRCDFQI